MKQYEDIKKNLIKSYLLENDEVLIEVVRAINCYNSSLDYLDYWENDEAFFDTFFIDRPMELARSISYGDYSYDDDYVKFNGYGNLESCDEYDFIKELKLNIDDIVEELNDCWEQVDIEDDDLLELLEDVEEEDEE